VRGRGEASGKKPDHSRDLRPWKQKKSPSPFEDEDKDEDETGRYAKSFETALAFTSSRGWLRWFITMVSGSMPKLW